MLKNLHHVDFVSCIIRLGGGYGWPAAGSLEGTC